MLNKTVKITKTEISTRHYWRPPVYLTILLARLIPINVPIIVIRLITMLYSICSYPYIVMQIVAARLEKVPMNCPVATAT